MFLTLSASFTALQAMISTFIATASVQQLHPALLQSDTFDTKASIVAEQEPVRVVLRVISLHLVEMEELQPASVDPAEEAKEADLVFEDVDEHDGLERFPPTISVRIKASIMNTVLLDFLFLTILA